MDIMGGLRRTIETFTPYTRIEYISNVIKIYELVMFHHEQKDGSDHASKKFNFFI